MGRDRQEPLTTACVAQAGRDGVRVVPGIRPLYPSCLAVGPALTCSCPPRDNLALHRALAQAPPGCVLVCEASGCLDRGYFGELMGIDARNRGVVGLVINGAVRDALDLERMAFAVFCAGTAPHPCRKEAKGAVGDSIVVNGVMIESGDYIVADRDGVVAISSELWPEISSRASLIARAEVQVRARLHRGERLYDILDLPDLQKET